MTTVAIIGADGAGKTTVIRSLPGVLALPMTSIYMGVNLESSTLMLPTTRLLLFLLGRPSGRGPGRAAPTARQLPRHEQQGAAPRIRRSARATARLLVWVSEELFRQAVAWYHSRVRSKVVVFDRHFFADYYRQDVAGDARPLTRRVHGFLLERVYAKPDLVIFLDAPPEVLYARKPETPVAWLRSRREEYARLRDVVPQFVRVDASRPLEDVTREVACVIERFEARRRAHRAAGEEAT
jgi:thymidylate kinase